MSLKAELRPCEAHPSNWHWKMARPCVVGTPETWNRPWLLAHSSHSQLAFRPGSVLSQERDTTTITYGRWLKGAVEIRDRQAAKLLIVGTGKLTGEYIRDMLCLRKGMNVEFGVMLTARLPIFRAPLRMSQCQAREWLSLRTPFVPTLVRCPSAPSVFLFLNRGLKVDFLGVTQDWLHLEEKSMRLVQRSFCQSRCEESRFPFTELPFDGIFGLGLGGLSVPHPFFSPELIHLCRNCFGPGRTFL